MTLKSIDQIILGVERYFENEIGSKATGLKKFASYFVFASYKNKLPQMINETTSQLGIPTQDGMIDIESVYQYAKEAYKHTGQFTVAGIIFNESDIDKLYNEVRNA